MPDQPIPDFSQNQQYAPGFQAQQPIPGISSSYNQPQYQQQQQQYFQQQQPDFSYMQANNARTTMALTQQNLMYSMHNALLGTMTAFSDVSRRGSSMITAMSPTGRGYNDMLMPNQNWALESSFRREIGYGIGQRLGLDPYNSPLSRLIQGRRPEFLTEGEYASTMGFAHQLRTEQFEKGAISLGASAVASYATGALGLGLASSIIIPGIGLAIGDRMLEAQYAESEDLLKGQIEVKNKRVGIGQQFINTQEYAKVHNSIYEQSNPYWSRFFGDNALGNSFKPDVQKLKIFEQAKDNGLLAFENLDADSLIANINKISEAVEKFSRIGKVTREASIKMMSELKSSGITGDFTIADYSHAAMTSSITGLDMQALVGMKSQVARNASYLGFDTYSASSMAENTLSGFAMMQANGLFKQKDIMHMTQTVNDYNMLPPGDVADLLARYGTIPNAIKEMKVLGKGDIATGLQIYKQLDLPVVDKVHSAIDLATKAGYKTWEKIQRSPQFSLLGGNRELIDKAHEYFLGGEQRSAERELSKWIPRINGGEEGDLEVTDLTNNQGTGNRTINAYFGRAYLGERNRYFERIKDSQATDLLQKPRFKKIVDVMKNVYKGKHLTGPRDYQEAIARLNQMYQIGRDGKIQDSSGWFGDDLEKEFVNAFGSNKDRRIGGTAILEAVFPNEYKDMEAYNEKEEREKTPLGVMLQDYKGIGNNGDIQEQSVNTFINNINGRGELNQIRNDIIRMWQPYSGLNKDKKNLDTFREELNNRFEDYGLNLKDTQQTYALMGSLNEPLLTSNSAISERMRLTASRAGIKEDNFVQAMKSVSKLKTELYDKEGHFRSEMIEGKTNRVSNLAEDKLYEKIQQNPDFARYQFGVGYDNIVSTLRDHGALRQDEFGEVEHALRTLKPIETDEEIEEAKKRAKEAQDPAGSAIDKMNDILGQILRLMGGKPPEASKIVGNPSKGTATTVNS